MPKTQTKTPTEKAQIALARADEHLAKQRERLEKIATKVGAIKAKYDELLEQHRTLAGEIAFSQRSRDLLATHPLLAGTAPVAQDALPEASEEAPTFVVPTEDAEIDGQTSIEDFTAPEPEPTTSAGGIQVRENENKRPGVFAAVPDFDGDAEPGVETADDTDPDAPFEL